MTRPVFAPGGLLDQAGWAITRVLRRIGPIFVGICMLATMLAAIIGDWSLAGALALNALFQAVAFSVAIAVGTWMFGPRKDGAP